MARGKIQIKRIENRTNRQVTYSKRRNGLFKKANELTVLCDANVSIIMFSSTDKLHEFISPSITTKEFFDQYQTTLGIDLWGSHYERMQENLNKVKEINRRLRTKIRQRLGECLNTLSFEELGDMRKDVESSINSVRERKMKVIGNQIDTWKKKVKNVEQIHRNLLNELFLIDHDAREDPQYGYVDNEVDYDSVIGFSNGGPVFALGLQQPNQPNIHNGAGSDLTTYPLLN